MEINGNIVSEFVSYQSNFVGAFLPLLAMITGVFLAFAIANSLRFFILKLLKR